MAEDNQSRWRREILDQFVLGEIDTAFPIETDPSTTRKLWSEFLDKVMDRLVTKRRTDEAKIIANGKEPVWFSHKFFMGGLKHWVVILYDHKFELRRTSRACCHRIACTHDIASFCCVEHECGKNRCCEGHQCGRGPVCPNHAPVCENGRIDGYHFKQGPFDIKVEQRERAIGELGVPRDDRYYIGLIGSTSMSLRDVENKFKAKMEEFGDYGLFTNNCQNFVVEVAKQIIEDRAPDWKWFEDNLVSSKRHRYVGRLHGIPIDVMAAWLETLKEQRNQVSADKCLKVERNIRNLELFIETFKEHVAAGRKFRKTTNVDFFPNISESERGVRNQTTDIDDGIVEFPGLHAHVGAEQESSATGGAGDNNINPGHGNSSSHDGGGGGL